MGRTATALVGFAGWFALLSVALGVYRLTFVMGGRKAVNAFASDGQDLDSLGHRLTRARNNCYETLPLFAAIALGASIAGGSTSPTRSPCGCSMHASGRR